MRKTKPVKVTALAVDFGGTVACPGPSPDAATVAWILRELSGPVIPDGFATAFEEVVRRARIADQPRHEQTSFAELLRLAALESGVRLDDPVALAQSVFTTLPDADIDPMAAHTLRNLYEAGLVCLLACDTQRPESVRRATLRRARIEDCFEVLVLSSTLGVRKPHPWFYAAVIEAAGCPPQEILFVGDTQAKDAVGPLAHGMRAVLISPDGRPSGLDPRIGVIAHLSELPAYLESLHAH
ncbi:HAD family hydrolase [Streptosporangium amethystogenes subsp. fukuiense]|uniref:HAD family hydrolase n=1 Tax=Streptosporangium amethystogenes subsp. fukuiense TaxID=698418 RepID=A0ABW2STS4_9ACTN